MTVPFNLVIAIISIVKSRGNLLRLLASASFVSILDLCSFQ